MDCVCLIVAAMGALRSPDPLSFVPTSLLIMVKLI